MASSARATGLGRLLTPPGPWALGELRAAGRLLEAADGTDETRKICQGTPMRSQIVETIDATKDPSEMEDLLAEGEAARSAPDRRITRRGSWSGRASARAAGATPGRWLGPGARSRSSARTPTTKIANRHPFSATGPSSRLREAAAYYPGSGPFRGPRRSARSASCGRRS